MPEVIFTGPAGRIEGCQKQLRVIKKVDPLQIGRGQGGCKELAAHIVTTSPDAEQGLAGVRLQNFLPRARVLYVSATGATTPFPQQR